MLTTRAEDSIARLGEAIQGLQRIGVLVFEARAESTLAPLKAHARFLVERSSADEAAAFAAAARLRDAGCEMILIWGLADSLDRDQPAGTLVVPTRVIDAAADEAFETAAQGRRGGDRVVLLTTEDLQDRSAKRRLGMRYQAIAADAESAIIARFSCWNDVPFAVVRSIADTAMEVWASKAPGRLTRRLRSQLPVAVRPWATTPKNIWRRWQEQRRARQQLLRAARSLTTLG